MTWLLMLYPRRWRHRYGEEFLALIAPQRFSFVTVLDIVGGAIDAWTRPQSHLAAPAAARSEGDTIMLAKMLRLRCAGHGAKSTTADVWKGAGVCLGGTLVSVLVATWMHRQSVDAVYTQALMISGWLFSCVVSLPYTALKGWPRRTQAILVGVLLMLVALPTVGGLWLNSR